jgi:hypothetical protein
MGSEDFADLLWRIPVGASVRIPSGISFAFLSLVERLVKRVVATSGKKSVARGHERVLARAPNVQKTVSLYLDETSFHSWLKILGDNGLSALAWLQKGC